MSGNQTAYHYCDLEAFRVSYERIHGPLSVLVCVFGCVANILNVCVLTSKEMRWPTNLILTGLAIADFLVMLEYIPFAFQRYIFDRKYASMYTYQWAVFTVFHALFSQICHFISCCLTVLLAVCRLVTIMLPALSNRLFSIRYTVNTIITTYVMCPLICIPVVLSMDIESHVQRCALDGRIIDKEIKYTKRSQNLTIYVVNHNVEYRTLSLWIYGVIIKLIPCILLTVLSSGLICVLLKVKQRRKRLLGKSYAMTTTAHKPILAAEDAGGGRTLQEQNSKKKADQDRQADRTTNMLLAVLLLFLMTEFPQAILGLLSVIIGPAFERQCYGGLGDVMDILALTNSAINFILYCTMSRQFRSTFKSVFWNMCTHWISLTHTSTETHTDQTQLSHV